MKLALSLFASAALVFLAIDMVWLGLIARGFYASEMGALLKKSPNLGAALAFYVLYCAGLTFFVLLPNFAATSLLKVALIGAAFGLVAYGTYDLTNLAVVEGFNLRLAVVDMLWGAVLSGSASAAAVAITRAFLGASAP